MDYQNLISWKSMLHGSRCDAKIDYVDDVCGPTALEAVRNLKEGRPFSWAICYLTEEISHFEGGQPDTRAR